MSAKNVIIKRKIQNDIFELYPKTVDSQVSVTYASEAQTLASALSTIYTDLNSWNDFKASVDFAGQDAALDTLREIIDTLSDDSVVNGVINRVKGVEDAIGTDATSGTVKYRIKQVEDAIGDTSTSGTIKYDVNQLKTTVGDSTAGLVKDVDDLQTAVGDSNSGLVKDVADLQTANESLAHIIFVATGETIPNTVTTADLIFQEVAAS